MSSGDYLRKAFSQRFAATGAGFIYRATAGAPGIALSPEERLAMEADLDQRIRRVGVLANGWILLVAALAAPSLLGLAGASTLAQIAGLFGVLFLASVVQCRRENRVLKQLGERAPVYRGLSRIEVFLLEAANNSWRRSVVFTVASFVILDKTYKTPHDGPSWVALIVISGTALCYCCLELGAKLWLTLRRSARA